MWRDEANKSQFRDYHSVICKKCLQADRLIKTILNLKDALFEQKIKKTEPEKNVESQEEALVEKKSDHENEDRNSPDNDTS